MNKLELICELWMYRSMSLIGKILVVNTLMSSLYVYKFQVLPLITQQHIHRFNDTVNKFLWKGRKPKIPLRILQKEKEFGGLGLVDLQKRHTALLTNWVQRIQCDKECRNLAEFFLPYSRDNFIWKCNLSSVDAHKEFNCNNFWSNVLRAWCVYNFQVPQSNENIVLQIIWFNSNIRSQGSVLKPTANLP